VFDEKTASPEGFKQWIGGVTAWAYTDRDHPGYVPVPKHKAFVYTHGKHREPVNGVSDLDVCFAAYENKQKLKFLWAQYLECQSHRGSTCGSGWWSMGCITGGRIR
jgi:hypothetical protein